MNEIKATSPIPKPDANEISKALDVLCGPGAVVELRAIHKRRKRTAAGYFDGEHRSALVSAAIKLNNDDAAIYITLNPVDPQLLGRYNNRIEQFASSTATDANITSRRWLLIDIDPKRPKDTAATELQLELAKQKAREIFTYLKSCGWSPPIVAESGNGLHLLYRVDLPNDDQSRDLIKGILNALADRFDDDAISVDRSVFNAARIVKLHGTVATKGDHTVSNPWRLSKIITIPAPLAIVSLDQLQALVPVRLQETPRQRPVISSSFNLKDFLSRLSIPYQMDVHSGRERYKLDYCPFNQDHRKGDAAIFRDTNGTLGFKCLHNGCADKAWQDVRALVDGPVEGRRTAEAPTPPAGHIVNRAVSVELHDFLSFDFPPRNNLLSPWLPSQGLTMVYAARGVGKTHFALGLAYAVASGGIFLGWQAPYPSGVLYIDGEMPGAVMQERLSAIVASNDLEPSAPFTLLTPDLQPECMPRIDTEEGQQTIEAVLTDDIKLIVVDNISTLSQTRENEADGWTPVQAWALKQRAAGRSVLFVHHAGKGGQQRGTSRREDVLDTVISLRRPIDYQADQGAVFEIHFEKARGIYGDDVKPIEATLSTDDLGRISWRIRTVECGTFDRVVQLLNDGLKQGEIAAELGVNKGTVSRHAKKARADGLVNATINERVAV